MSQKGGLLNLCILATESKFVAKDTKLLMHHQTPFYFLNGMSNAERMQPNHIEMLQQAITNVKDINQLHKNKLDCHPLLEDASNLER